MLAFIDDVNKDFAKDGVTQTWSEYLAQTGDWSNNVNIKAQLTVNQYADNSDQKAPPQQRDQLDQREQRRLNHNHNNIAGPNIVPPVSGEGQEEPQRNERRKQMFRRVNKLDL